MIGNGKNRKSMAYIDNVIAFLMECIKCDDTYGLYNYVDTPDMTMNELVYQVRNKLMGSKSVGLRLPYWLGLLIGYTADLITITTGKKMAVSSLRIKKFSTSTEFRSAKKRLNGFEPPFNIVQGIEKTLQSEFVSPDPDREIFFTE